MDTPFTLDVVRWGADAEPMRERFRDGIFSEAQVVEAARKYFLQNEDCESVLVKRPDQTVALFLTQAQD